MLARGALCVRMHVQATHLIACGSLFTRTTVNSKEILLDLPLHLFCVMSLPAMCGAHCQIDRPLLKKWKKKKSNTWTHLP